MTKPTASHAPALLALVALLGAGSSIAVQASQAPHVRCETSQFPDYVCMPGTTGQSGACKVIVKKKPTCWPVPLPKKKGLLLVDASPISRLG